MRTYSEFSPTQFDQKGMGLDDKQTWLVAPVAHNRDSGLLAKSNWDVFVQELTLKCKTNTWEICRFGHWANGWFEIIIIQPETNAELLGNTTEDSLADYPVLDSIDFSDKEENAMVEYWKSCSLRERLELISRFNERKSNSENNISIFASRKKHWPEPLYEDIRDIINDNY